MIRSLPDFGTRLTEGAEGKAADVNGDTEAGHGATNGAVASSTPYAANGEQSKPKKPESVVEWFLRTCGLEVDDIAEPKTQRALIDEYMGVGTVTLRETPGHPLSIATLGEGEDYPLAETGLPLDVAASNNAGGASGHRETQNTTLNPRPARGVVLLRRALNGILPSVGDVGGPKYIHCRTQVEAQSEVAVEKEVQEAKRRAVRAISGVGVHLPLRYSEDPKFSLVC